MFRLRNAVEARTEVPEVRTYFNETIKRFLDTKCEFCEGYGHKAKSCSTKRAMDKNLRGVGYALEWGRVKNAVLVEGMVAQRTANRRLRQELRADAQRFFEQTHPANPQNDIPPFNVPQQGPPPRHHDFQMADAPVFMRPHNDRQGNIPPHDPNFDRVVEREHDQLRDKVFHHQPKHYPPNVTSSSRRLDDDFERMRMGS